MDLCGDTPTHTPYTIRWLHSVLAAEAEGMPTSPMPTSENKILKKNFLNKLPQLTGFHL